MHDTQAIAVWNLTKYYGDFCAVVYISFDVEVEHVFGFLGPNSVGKTTTIRMPTEISTPTEGSAYLSGFDITA
jgi:ABC-2 type transport system ATP-binding protein